MKETPWRSLATAITIIAFVTGIVSIPQVFGWGENDTDSKPVTSASGTTVSVISTGFLGGGGRRLVVVSASGDEVFRSPPTRRGFGDRALDARGERVAYITSDYIEGGFCASHRYGTWVHYINVVALSGQPRQQRYRVFGEDAPRSLVWSDSEHLRVTVDHYADCPLMIDAWRLEAPGHHELTIDGANSIVGVDRVGAGG